MPTCLHRLRGLPLKLRSRLTIGDYCTLERLTGAGENRWLITMRPLRSWSIATAASCSRQKPSEKPDFSRIACHLAQNPKPVWQVVREGRRQGDALPERWAVKRSDGSSAQANTFASARTHYLLGRVGCWTRKAFSSSITTCF